MSWKRCPECQRIWFDSQEKGGIYCSESCNKKSYRNRRKVLNFINLINPNRINKFRGGKNV